MSHNHHPASHTQNKIDFLLWGSLIIITIAYFAHMFGFAQAYQSDALTTFTSSAYELINTIWFGLLLGIVSIGFLGIIPREFIISMLGKSGGLTGIIRATGAGLLLDLCSHGVLMVGMKLYERGASTGQVMAFLIASPWNSFSLTLVLWALVGFWWMLAFILGSFIIAIISGLIFEYLVAKKILPENPNTTQIPDDFNFRHEAKIAWQKADQSFASIKKMLWHGLLESRMVLRWILFGVVLAGLIRSFVPTDTFETLLGPTVAGLGLTIVIATILEVCSEGSMPVAADILTKAAAPGNAFAFLMTGVSTDYTEIMALKETTKSWKIPLFLPLVTLPQVILLSWLLNIYGL